MKQWLENMPADEEKQTNCQHRQWIFGDMLLRMPLSSHPAFYNTSCNAAIHQRCWKLLTVRMAHIPLGSSCHVSTRRVCQSMLFDKLDTGKMHGLDTSNTSSCLVSRRDEPSRIWANDSYLSHQWLDLITLAYM